jgi:hypothetical protein
MRSCISELFPLPQGPETAIVSGGLVLVLRKKREMFLTRGFREMEAGSFQLKGWSEMATSSIESMMSGSFCHARRTAASATSRRGMPRRITHRGSKIGSSFQVADPAGLAAITVWRPACHPTAQPTSEGSTMRSSIDTAALL